MFIVNWLLLSQQLADDSSSFMSWSQDNHPFHSWLSFSLSIPCWNSDPQNFQTAKTKSKDTWEKVTQREALWNITPQVEFSDPNYKLIQMLYSQLWRISKTINLDHCITNQRGVPLQMSLSTHACVYM